MNNTKKKLILIEKSKNKKIEVVPSEENKGSKVILFSFLTVLFLVLVFLYAMFFGTEGLIVKEYNIVNPKLTNGYDGLKIVHISDLHYGGSVDKEDLIEMVNEINLLKPDIVVFTGDLSNGSMTSKMIDDSTEVLGKIEATVGKYAIDGNHDYKLKEWAIIMENSGFKNLNNTYELIYIKCYDPILIAGISNNSYGTKKIKDKIESVMEYFSSEENTSLYNILLLHEPDYVDDIDNSKFNLVLAGHSHNGQVRLPFIGALFTPTGSRTYYKEHYSLKNTDLYISSGMGTSNIDIRLFNKPSFNFYRLTSK